MRIGLVFADKCRRNPRLSAQSAFYAILHRQATVRSQTQAQLAAHAIVAKVVKGSKEGKFRHSPSEQKSFMDPIRILICDDHEPFRQGLHMMLSVDRSLAVLGEAADGFEAIALASQVQPDVILMDLQMPRLHGLEATRRIISGSPHIRILILTMSDDTATVFHALQAGARGYILKGARESRHRALDPQRFPRRGRFRCARCPAGHPTVQPHPDRGSAQQIS